MKKNTIHTGVAALALAALLLGGCGRNQKALETAAPALSAAPVEAPVPEAETGRQDGERFEAKITLEGMEETVRYEHIRNDAVGIEMDYDYEQFIRHSEADRERFVSRYDAPENPQYYLELTSITQDAENVAAAIAESLSEEYEISRNDAFMLDRAGPCIRIDASEVKGGGFMPDLLQMVYVIPAPDGCRVALQHYYIEGAEGFGVRFRNMMHTLAVIPRSAESVPSGTWQTASMGSAPDGTMAPEYHVQFTDADVVYGHMRDGQFVQDHADRIIRLEKTASGGFRIQAETSNGARYTYQTCESDPSILEYYETWDENAFPESYRGGASLSRTA